MATFTTTPSSASQSKQPRVRKAVFGDGYQQRTGDGINNNGRAWNLSFTKDDTDIDTAEAFLDARAGAESFDWTPPSGAAGKWVCSTWTRGVTPSGVDTLTATFTEVFGE